MPNDNYNNVLFDNRTSRTHRRNSKTGVIMVSGKWTDNSSVLKVAYLQRRMITVI